MIRLALSSQDVKLQRALSSALRSEYDIATESNPRLLKPFLANGSFDVLLLDLDLEALTAETYIRLYRETAASGVAVVLMANGSGLTTAMELVKQGAHSYCRKPPSLPELKALLRSAHEDAVLLRAPNAKSRFPDPPEIVPACDELIGSSTAMHQLYDLVHRVAGLRASVLITGETGTGKELIARAIHNLGPRKNQPFVAVSCGAVPETLIESELFGHEKGAFTGSVGSRVGYFEQAAGGTLFLDEIGELTLQTQVKLLRVLQQKEFARLGSSRPVPLKARLIFATHRNLPGMIEEGKFRLDLYYRLNVMTVHSPSLAERPDDICLLARHFLSQYSEHYGKDVTSISAAALTALERYEWPGNVRELENVIQQAIIRADSAELQLSNLPAQICPTRSHVTMEEDVVQAGTFERLLRDYKVKLAMKAIEDCNGNKTLAARSLDISRAYLHRLIQHSEKTVVLTAESGEFETPIVPPSPAPHHSQFADVLSFTSEARFK